VSSLGLRRAIWLPAERHHTATWAMLAALAGAAVGVVIVVGSLKLLLLVAGAVLLVLGVVRPQLILWLIVVLTVCFSEARYGLMNPSDTFTLASYVLDPFRLNLYEILIYSLFAVLLMRRVIRQGGPRMPMSIAIPSLVLASACILQLVRGLLEGASYESVVTPFNGQYALMGVVALWCFFQLLGTSDKRLRLLDGLFLLATLRAAYGLFGYFFGDGDSANAYRELGVKVALWDSADHMLFVFLIVTCLAAWATRRLGHPRILLWMPASTLMAVTVLLSFRRTGWLGLAIAVGVAAFLLARRSKRAAILVPAIVMTAAAVLQMSYRRFAGSGSVVSRLFPDLANRTGPTRQDEWAMAWTTITDNPLLGDATSRRVTNALFFWDTRIVHNAFLFTWMKFGFFGLLALVVLAASCLRYAIRAIRERSADEYMGLGVVGIAPFVLLVSVTGTPLIEVRMVIVLALLGSIGVLAGLSPAQSTVGQLKE